MTTTPLWLCLAALLLSFGSSRALVASPSVQAVPPQLQQQPVLAGDWAGAKAALRNPDCCVVSVSGLEPHLVVLQEQWENGPADVDLRARVRVGSSSSDDTTTYDDCLQVCRAVSLYQNTDQNKSNQENDPCAAALRELARGVASLADGPFERVCQGVFLRIVCASSYKARDPMFHTDKAPLRGYVTLCGPGTDFMRRTSTPMEYMALRGLGSLPLGDSTTSLRRAQALEFIVMKGDHYLYEPPSNTAKTETATKASWMSNNYLWKLFPDRTSACVHRSPPADDATTGGRRRIIVSLDLADGSDDREWYEIHKKRAWRSGMTQRKSRLVA